MKRVAVIGGGISGIGAAYSLATSGAHVVLYQKEHFLCGPTKTITTILHAFDFELAFMYFNRVTHPNLVELFDSLGIDMEVASDMSFSASLDYNSPQGFEWGSRNGLKGLFAQKSNIMSSEFLKMLLEIKRFKDEVIMYLDDLENNLDMKQTETLGHFMKSRAYSELFQNAYLVPMCASVWPFAPDQVMHFSAFTVLSSLRSHDLLRLSGRPLWHTVKQHKQYVNKLHEELEDRGCHIKTGCEVHTISTTDNGCMLFYGDGLQDVYDACILAVSAPHAIRMLGKEATHDEMRILGALQYINSDVYLHHDKTFMPRNTAAWSAWNFQGCTDSNACLTNWINMMQNDSETTLPIFATFNPPHPPKDYSLRWSISHLVPSISAIKASLELDIIQGKRRIWFCDSYHGHVFHENALKSGFKVAHAVLGTSLSLLENPKQMVPSWTEAAARYYVINFLHRFITAGCLDLLEDGGTVHTFKGSDNRCLWKTSIKVHNPQFYSKIVVEADFGLADAFINGDISVVDKDQGLLNLFRIFIANLYLYPPSAVADGKRFDFRGWRKQLFTTACIASVKYLYRHFSRRNTVKLARQNISRHYDLSNEMFSLFLDETMTYSCAIFKSENEDLKVAQLRKLHLLIKKARVERHHEVLDIGCGWGSLAIEIGKTGCKYTGITLSKEQLKFAEQRAKEAGLQDHIKFLLCDYRELSNVQKYDRIISIGMIEHVGDQFYEDFFRHCELLLAENGILVLQTISVPDEMYDVCKSTSDFAKEYIFQGGCLPSLSRLTSAMVTASRLCVEQVENIGVHYAQTLRCWRKNFLKNQSEIRALGFDDKFMRVWEYYFDYTASGFMTRTLGDYQIVFSRQGNLVAFSDPYESIPSVDSFP